MDNTPIHFAYSSVSLITMDEFNELTIRQKVLMLCEHGQYLAAYDHEKGRTIFCLHGDFYVQIFLDGSEGFNLKEISGFRTGEPLEKLLSLIRL